MCLMTDEKLIYLHLIHQKFFIVFHRYQSISMRIYLIRPLLLILFLTLINFAP